MRDENTASQWAFSTIPFFNFCLKSAWIWLLKSWTNSVWEQFVCYNFPCTSKQTCISSLRQHRRFAPGSFSLQAKPLKSTKRKKNLLCILNPGMKVQLNVGQTRDPTLLSVTDKWGENQHREGDWSRPPVGRTQVEQRAPAWWRACRLNMMTLSVASDLAAEGERSYFPSLVSFSASQLFSFSTVVSSLFDVGGRRALALF